MSKKLNHLLFSSLIMVLIAISLAGCKKDDDKKGSDSGSKDLTTVRVQLSWTHSNEYAPMYMAQANGYYASADITTDLNPLVDAQGNYLNVMDEVTSGRAQFGVADAGAIMVARSEGKPVVAVMAIYQRHPLALVSLKEKNIIRPQDLVGKTVQLTPQSRVIFDAMLAAQNIDPTTVNIVDRTDFSITPLTSGDADVIDAWVTNEVVTLNQQNIAFNSIYTYDYGVDMYPDLLFTTEDIIKNSPAMVQGFVSGTIKGINDTLAQRDKAAELTVARDSALVLEVEKLSIAQGVPLLVPAGSEAGVMKPENWEVAHSILVEENVLTTPIDVTKAYDLTFVNKFYNK